MKKKYTAPTVETNILDYSGFICLSAHGESSDQEQLSKGASCDFEEE